METHFIPDYITRITGITNEMLLTAPPLDEVLPALHSFIGSAVVVGHNVGFDINFLYDSFSRYGIVFDNNFVDTMRIARKLYPALEHHRLSDIVEHCGVSHEQAHRAESDVCATIDCFEKMKAEIVAGIGVDAFAAAFIKRHDYKVLEYVKAPSGEIDESNPLYRKTVVFTGVLSSMPRKDALQIVANLGGVPANSVTKKTNILVVGNEDFVASVKDGKTAKMRKAEDLEVKGFDIITISENTFFDMIKE